MNIFAWLALICLPALFASEAVRYLITIPNFLFFQQSYDILKEFFGSLDFVRQRLQSPLGKDFESMCLSYSQAPFVYQPIANLIKKLEYGDIVSILRKGNRNEIRFFFGHYFRYYTKPSELNLFPKEVPNLHLFPIDSMSSSILAGMPVTSLTKILSSRSKFGLISDFYNLLYNLPAIVWNDFRIFSEPELAVYFSPLALPDFRDSRIPYSEATKITKTPEVSEIFEGVILQPLKQLWLNFAAVVDRLSTVNVRKIKQVSLMVSILGYNLQSIVHIMIANGSIDTLLFSLTVKVLHGISKALQEAVSSHPEVDPVLSPVIEGLSICHSSLIWSHFHNPESKFYPLLKKYFASFCSEKGTMASTLRFLRFPSSEFDYRSLDVIHKRLVLLPLFMLAEETIDGEFALHVERVAEAIKSDALPLDSFLNEIGLRRNLNSFISQYPQHALPILEVAMRDRNRVFSFRPETLFKLELFTQRNPNLVFDMILSSTLYREDDSNGRRNVILNASDLAQTLEADGLSLTASAASIPTLPENMTLPNYKYLDLSFIQDKSSPSLIILDLPDLPLDLKDNSDDFSLVLNAFTRYSKSLDEAPASIPANDKPVDIYDFIAPSGLIPEFSDNLIKDFSALSAQEDNVTNDFCLQAPKFSKDAPSEIQYIEGVLSGLMQFIKNPNSSISVRFPHILTTTGRGLLIEAVSTFGRLISLPQVRTVQFSESLGGFVPAPFLCPKVMALLGVWISLSWSLNSQLLWGFSDRFLKFLLYEWDDSSNAATDELILTMYPELFQGIKDRFRYASIAPGEDFYLPLSFRPHRMFSIPAPYSADPSPFIFESRAFDLEIMTVKHLRPTQKSLSNIDEARYTRMVVAYLRKNLLEGRLEFQRHFRLAFSQKLNSYFNYPTVSRFFHASEIDVDDLISSLNFDSFESINNDIPGATTATVEARPLMIHFIKSLDKHFLQRFLCFITSTGAAPLGGFRNSPIAIKPAKGARLSSSKTCLRTLLWYIDVSSANNTLRLLHDTINLSSGFIEVE